MILSGCPQRLFAEGNECPVGFLHHVLPADIKRLDTGDSHTPFSDTLYSVGQDDRQRMDSVGDLEQYMTNHQAHVQTWNEVCAHVNFKTVVGLLCSTDFVKKSLNPNVERQGRACLVSLQQSGFLPSLPIFTWHAASGMLVH